MPILEGLDGVQKMSKSLGNYIGIADKPDEMFGKIMSISDGLMWRYYELLSFSSLDEIAAWRKACDEGVNPKESKVRLAKELVERFHDAEAADRAEAQFEARFKKGAMPDDIEEKALGEMDGGYPIANLLKDAGLTSSTSESFRMIKQGAVKIDGKKVEDKALLMACGTCHIYQVGKRKFAKVMIGNG